MIINHSGIGMLSCPRRYQLRVFHKCKDIPSEPLLIGSAIHSIIEQFHLAGQSIPSFNIALQVNEACDKYNVNGQSRGKVLGAIMAILGSVKEPILIGGAPACEVKVNIPLEDYNIQATLDEIYISNGRVILNDYKSTGYISVDKVVEKYKVSSQIPFYLYLLPHILPPEYSGLPLYGQYTIIPYNKSPITIQRTQLQLPNDEAVESLIAYAASIIRGIAGDFMAGDLCPPLGMATKECAQCPYQPICFSKDIPAAIAAWEKEDYDPMKFR